VIATIDDSDARLQLASAQASVNQAIAGVRQAEARLGLSPNGTFNAATIPEVRAANANYEQSLAELRQAELLAARSRELQAQTDLNRAISEFQRSTGTTLTANNVSVN